MPILILTNPDPDPEDLARLHSPQIQTILKKGSVSREELIQAVMVFVHRWDIVSTPQR
jgi:hypothetical protein